MKQKKDYIPVMNRPDWDKPLFEQKESKTAMQIIKSHLSCNCNEMYESRGMINPDCVLHEYATEIELMMEEYRQQPEVTDEEIEEWIHNDAHWAKTFINGAIYGAKAMRDRLIPKR